MNIEKGTRLTVWSPEKKDGRVITAICSSYEGKDKDDNPKYSSWFTRFVGDAYSTADGEIEEKDFIKVISANVDNRYDKEKGKTYITLTIFDFDWVSEEERKPSKSKKRK